LLRKYFHIGEVFGAVAVLLAMFQMLWIAWSTGETTFLSIGGYLPWSDASWWYNGCLRLLLDGELVGFNATRIVNEVFVAALLGISGQDLQVALVLRTVLVAVATFLFVREVAYRLGIAPAVVTTIVMVAFIGRLTSTMMTEPTAFLFGVLGAALLLIGTDDQKPQFFAAGLFLVTLGLAARPGPFLVLPVLALWAGRFFREKRRFAIRPTLLSTAGVASGLAVAALLKRFYTASGTVSFDHFGFVLYGLAQGGKPWSAVLKPGAPGLNADLAMQQALTMIRVNPFPLLVGMLGFVLRFLKDQLLYMNSYPWECCSAYRHAQWYRAPFVLLEAIGLTYALRPNRSRIEQLCVMVFAGCVFSSAFTFWNAEAYRTFASTNALEALLIGLGASAICRVFGLQPKDSHHFMSSAKVVCIISVAIVALSMFTPLMATIVRLHYRSRPVSASWCAKDSTPLIIDLGRSSPFLRIRPPGSGGFVPNVAEDNFLRDKTFYGIGIAPKLDTLRSGDVLVLAHDLSGLNDHSIASQYYPIWLIIHGPTELPAPARYRVCSAREDIPTQWGVQAVFTAQTIEPVEPATACAGSSSRTQQWRDES
jgi:hypothetical protein